MFMILIAPNKKYHTLLPWIGIIYIVSVYIYLDICGLKYDEYSHVSSKKMREG